MVWVGETRKFQVWGYTVSHAQLLLRSVQESGTPRRVDVLFKGVEYVSLTTSFDASQIEEAGTSDMARFDSAAGELLARMPGRSPYLLSGPSGERLVVAAAVFVHEDELDYFDRSAFEIQVFGSGSPGVL